MKLSDRTSLRDTPGGSAVFGVARAGEWLCGLVAAACFAYVGGVAIDERAYQASQSARFATLVEAALHAEPQPTRSPSSSRRLVRAGDPVGRLEIPSVGVSGIVTAGTDETTLRRSIGWLSDTALPGEPGNVAIAGHRDTFFRGLRQLRHNDLIHFQTPTGTFDYRVDTLRVVSPEALSVLAPTAEPTLTMVTCYPFSYLGAAPMRYVVRAHQIPQTPPALHPAGR